MNTVVIIDQHASDLPAYTSSNECSVAIDVGVISRDGVERQSDPRNAEYQDGRQHQDSYHSNHQPSFQSRSMLAGGACAGRKISPEGLASLLSRRGFFGSGAGVDPSRLAAIRALLFNHNEPSA